MMTKTIRLGDNDIQVRATALTLLFYKQAFKRDLLGDLMTLQALEEDITQFDGLILLQFMYAMAKTEAVSDNLGKSYPTFEQWLSKLNRLDFSGEEIAEMVEVITDAYFRGNEGERQG